MRSRQVAARDVASDVEAFEHDDDGGARYEVVAQVPQVRAQPEDVNRQTARVLAVLRLYRSFLRGHSIDITCGHEYSLAIRMGLRHEKYEIATCHRYCR